MTLNITPLRAQVPGVAYTFRALPRDDQGNLLDEDAIEVELTVPPLNFTSLEVLHPKLTALDKMPLVEVQGLVCDALLQALRRNYRNVPRWLIADSIDARNFSDYLGALMAVSKLTPTAGDSASGNGVAAPTPQAPPAPSVN